MSFMLQLLLQFTKEQLINVQSKKALTPRSLSCSSMHLSSTEISCLLDFSDFLLLQKCSITSDYRRISEQVWIIWGFICCQMSFILAAKYWSRPAWVFLVCATSSRRQANRLRPSSRRILSGWLFCNSSWYNSCKRWPWK